MAWLSAKGRGGSGCLGGPGARGPLIPPELTPRRPEGDPGSSASLCLLPPPSLIWGPPPCINQRKNRFPNTNGQGFQVILKVFLVKAPMPWSTVKCTRGSWATRGLDHLTWFQKTCPCYLCPLGNA